MPECRKISIPLIPPIGRNGRRRLPAKRRTFVHIQTQVRTLRHINARRPKMDSLDTVSRAWKVCFRRETWKHCILCRKSAAIMSKRWTNSGFRGEVSSCVSSRSSSTGPASIIYCMHVAPYADHAVRDILPDCRGPLLVLVYTKGRESGVSGVGESTLPDLPARVASSNVDLAPGVAESTLPDLPSRVASSNVDLAPGCRGVQPTRSPVRVHPYVRPGLLLRMLTWLRVSGSTVLYQSPVAGCFFRC